MCIRDSTGVFIQVEVRNEKELEQAISASPSSILLDNMSTEEVKSAVLKIKSSNPDILVEISGGINKSNIEKYSSTGADRISVGALTHSAIAVDMSLRVSCLS